MCLAQGQQCSVAGEARIPGPSVSSQALYHCALILCVMGYNYMNTKCMHYVINEMTCRTQPGLQMIDHPGMIVSLEFHQKTILMNYIISSSDKVDFTIVIGFYTTCIRDTVNVLKY